jgi:hypothetical protein
MAQWSDLLSFIEEKRRALDSLASLDPIAPARVRHGLLSRLKTVDAGLTDLIGHRARDTWAKSTREVDVLRERGPAGVRWLVEVAIPSGLGQYSPSEMNRLGLFELEEANCGGAALLRPDVLGVVMALLPHDRSAILRDADLCRRISPLPARLVLWMSSAPRSQLGTFVRRFEKKLNCLDPEMLELLTTLPPAEADRLLQEPATAQLILTANPLMARIFRALPDASVRKAIRNPVAWKRLTELRAAAAKVVACLSAPSVVQLLQNPDLSRRLEGLSDEALEVLCSLDRTKITEVLFVPARFWPTAERELQCEHERRTALAVQEQRRREEETKRREQERRAALEAEAAAQRERERQDAEAFAEKVRSMLRESHGRS